MQMNGYGGGGRPNPQLVPEDGDPSIKRLRSELAEANDMINLLINHIQTTNSYSAEYDAVVDAIERRRVSEVANALDQIAWKRSHNHNHVDHNQRQLLEISESGFEQEQQVETVKESENSHGGEELEESKTDGRDDAATMEDDKCLNSTDDEKGECLERDNKNNSKNSAEAEESAVSKAETEVDAANESGCSTSSKDESTKLNLPMEAKIFAATEMIDEMLVNVVHGLKLYEEVIHRNGVAKFISLVKGLRAAGKAGKLVGQTYSVFNRPMRGRGKAVIQLGLPLVDAPVGYGDDNNTTVAAAHFKARKVEPIPAQLQDFIGQLVDAQILSEKPDSCIIDLYNEGNYSQPHMLLPWFGRPTIILFLSQCDMTFGRAIKSPAPGNYKGSIELSFAPGSLVVMEGLSADFSYRTINATKNERILITFTKLQPIKSVPPTKGPSNYMQNWVDPKHHLQIHPPGLLPTQRPTHHLPHLSPANNFLPHFMPVRVRPPLTYPIPGLNPHHGSIERQEPQHPIPGTGVFIPHGESGSESVQ